MSHENQLRNEVMFELAYVQSMCSKLFICPFSARKKPQIIGYYLICFFVLTTATQLLVTLIAAITESWLEVINIAPNLGVIVMAYIKYKKVFTQRELYEEILHHFQYDIWNIIAVNYEEHQNIVKKYNWIVKCCNRFQLYYSTSVSVLVNCFPCLFMLYENKVHGSIDEYLHPFDAWYPFDRSNWYVATYIWESSMTALIILIFAFTDALNACYVEFICMELRILGNCIEEILSPGDVVKICEGRNVEHIHRTVARKLKIIIEKYNFLAKISSQLDGVMGDAMLANYSLGAIFICLTAFTSTVVEVGYKQTRYLLMCLSLLVEIFVQCVIGQVISNHSTNFTEAIYFSNWPYASYEARKIMLLFMMRTQKPFQLTGKGYIVMNMNSFSNICSTSYQFYNLLRTVYK